MGLNRVCGSLLDLLTPAVRVLAARTNVDKTAIFARLLY